MQLSKKPDMPQSTRTNKAYGAKYSQAVTHPITNFARCCLIFVNERERTIFAPHTTNLKGGKCIWSVGYQNRVKKGVRKLLNFSDGTRTSVFSMVWS